MNKSVEIYKWLMCNYIDWLVTKLLNEKETCVNWEKFQLNSLLWVLTIILLHPITSH